MKWANAFGKKGTNRFAQHSVAMNLQFVKTVVSAKQESEMKYMDAISKMTEWSVRFQGKPFNITVIQAYAPTSNTEETEVEQFYEDLQELLELTPKKDVLFIIRD